MGIKGQRLKVQSFLMVIFVFRVSADAAIAENVSVELQCATI